MKISELKINNFRCFKTLELFFDHTQALIGENGSGKTAILEAIALATSGGQPYLNEQDFNNEDLGELTIEVKFDEPFLIRIPDGYSTKDIPCQSIFMGAHRREKAAPGKALSDPFVVERYAVPIEYNSGQAPNFTKAGSKFSIPESVTKTENGYKSPRKTGSDFTFTTNRLTLQNETINLPDVFYFDRDREDQAKVGFNSLLQKIAKDLNWRYRKDWNQAEIDTKWEAFYNQVISTVEDPKGGRIIQPLRTKLEDVTGFDFQSLELGLLDIEQPFTKTFFSKRDKTNQIENNRFGSGLAILLAYFLLDIISKLSKEEIIFLIDEPELHLHPQLQHILFKEFKSSKFQTIYTTQSDCFVNIADWKSILRFSHEFAISPTRESLEKTFEGKKLSAHLDEIKKWHQHESIFFREDNQIFFARKCLLVEGPAEKYGLPILAKKMGKNIDQTTIISCNGKSKIPYYQLLCKSFNIPFFTLFDLDGVKKDDGDNKRPYECADQSAISFFSTSFEKLFGISGGADHKTSDILLKIDDVKLTDIPKEIKESIINIEKWIAN